MQKIYKEHILTHNVNQNNNTDEEILELKRTNNQQIDFIPMEDFIYLCTIAQLIED
jgi:hypothetical protein